MIHDKLYIDTGHITSSSLKITLNNDTDLTNHSLLNVGGFTNCPPITDITTRLTAVENKNITTSVLYNVIPNANGNLLITQAPNYYFKTLAYGEGITDCFYVH